MPLLSALLLPALMAAAAPPAPAPPPDPAVVRQVRQAVIERLNRERGLAGVPALESSAALDEVAQARADEIGRRGALPAEAEALYLFGKVQRLMVKAGYTPHGWTESITVSAGDVGAVVDYWKGDPSYREAMGPDHRHLGIGLGEMAGVPLYTFLFAWPESDFFTRQTAPLADLAGVREQVLARVNAIRRDQGLKPLVLDARLSLAAQRHAEDMLARAYYSHQTPEGLTPQQRVLAAGYAPRIVGENIAEGQVTVDEVIDGWMKSSGHRRNILEPGFAQLGVGLAVGRWEDRYKLLWVQSFAGPLTAAR